MLLAILELHINIHERKRGEKSKETTEQGLAATALGYRGEPGPDAVLHEPDVGPLRRDLSLGNGARCWDGLTRGL